ncbi:hypothetical protein CDL15_Pgr016646 [Punica granatum]|uniref:Uncharacterized protein n=1 Tax=Punica granatum TaxID=22663 RepID=A0A218XSZ1_PUNGR|nr:hypothetical protein CDL15_Pgr016646 [Punica granatum]
MSATAWEEKIEQLAGRSTSLIEGHGAALQRLLGVELIEQVLHVVSQVPEVVQPRGDPSLSTRGSVLSIFQHAVNVLRVLFHLLIGEWSFSCRAKLNSPRGANLSINTSRKAPNSHDRAQEVFRFVCRKKSSYGEQRSRRSCWQS